MSQRPWLDRLTQAFTMAPIAAAASAVGVLALVVGGLTAALAPGIAATGRILVWLGLVLIGVAIVDLLRRGESTAAVRRRRYGASLGITITLVAALVILANSLAHATGFHADLTASKQFTLAEETAAVLNEIEGEIRVTAFFVDRAEGVDALQTALRSRVDDLLREFQRLSDGRLTYRFVDPETDPLAATSMGITRYPVVVFEAVESGRRYDTFGSSNVEQSFLTALLVVSGRGEKTTYVLTGHGELSLADDAPNSATGFGLARQGLANDGYRVAEINLVAAGAVPDDTATLIIPSPVSALSEPESAALDAYLKRGGRILALVEPESDPTWGRWLERWGVSANRAYVIDLTSHLTDAPGVPVVGPSQYRAPYITAGLDASVYPGLAPIGLIADPSSIPNLVDYDLIALTTPDSFAASSPSAAEPGADDLEGPFLVAAIVRALAPTDETPEEATASIGTLAVFGDGQFVSNRFFPALSNGDLFLNTVNELAGDVPLVPVRSKPLEFRGIVLTEGRYNVVRVIGYGALPALLAAGAVVAWLRRR